MIIIPYSYIQVEADLQTEKFRKKISQKAIFSLGFNVLLLSAEFQTKPLLTLIKPIF